MTAQPDRPDGRQAVPKELDVHGPNTATLEFLAQVDVKAIAEIGIYRGMTSERLAEYLGGEGELHLFDFDDVVEPVAARLKAAGFDNVSAHGNSRKLLDSYNWSLMKLLREHEDPIFDYVFLDGAHTWGVDGFAFFLIDRLLRPGGYLDLDDYGWSLGRSPTMRPTVLPITAELYTDEQIEARQVALVVDLLIRRDERYEEVVPQRIFRKRPT